ncbi:PAAR domain-containing protein [Oxalobacteraceae bacterium]|nr:PAAR domain-containing protein [Oxalobacteraceae bacterium]
MKHEGRGIIRLNDKTTHGGQVISASGSTVMGIPAALADDMTHCPQCRGDFPIQPDGKGAKHHGRAFAYHDDLTACCARLITSKCGKWCAALQTNLPKDICPPKPS